MLVYLVCIILLRGGFGKDMPDYLDYGGQNMPDGFDYMVQNMPENLYYTGFTPPEYVDQKMPKIPEYVDQEMPEIPDYTDQEMPDVPGQSCDDACQLESLLGETYEKTVESEAHDESMDYSLRNDFEYTDSQDNQQIKKPHKPRPQKSQDFSGQYFLGNILGYGIPLFQTKSILGFSQVFSGLSTIINSQKMQNKKGKAYKKSAVHAEPSIKPYDNTKEGYFAAQLFSLIGNIKCCKEQCSPFTDSWQNGKNAITTMFTNLTIASEKSGISAISDDLSTLKKVMKNIFALLKTTNLYDKYMIKRGIMNAIESRPDCKDIHMDSAHIFPELRASCNIYNDGAVDYAGESWDDITSYSRVSGDEQLLDYFREDDHLQIFHAEWHARNGRRGGKLRMRERFWYMHGQMLTRYRMERKIAGLPEVKPLNAHSGTFRTFYDTERGEVRSLEGFQRSSISCSLTDKAIRTLNHHMDIIRPTRNYNRTIEQFASIVETGYHNIGHNEVGKYCVYDPHVKKPNVLYSPLVNARDPVFFRWHWEVESLFLTFLKTLQPQSQQEILPPSGVIVEDVTLESCNRSNVVETFWETYDGNKYRLNHQNYTLRIRLSNKSERQGKIIVRVYIFLEDARDYQPIELDKFVCTLRGNQIEEITRNSAESSLAWKKRDDGKWIDRCGWPSNLQLPKGSPTGTPFRLVAMVHDPTDPHVNIGVNSTYSQVLCGGHEWDTDLVEDGRIMGFPFSKRWWNNKEKSKVLNNENSHFGNVTKMFTIRHMGIGNQGDCW